MVDGVVRFTSRVKAFSEMPSPFNVKGEVFSRNALTFKVKSEGISENPLTININVMPHKYLCTNIVFNQASENQHRIGMRNRKTKVGGAVRAGEGRCSRRGSYGTPLELLRPVRAERGR
ncbi:hypothetical protein [Clostridium sp. chh4-2]|uniref:hypothetical protein n=1 Tax=Clostridium sp. chh4-2 TaxID=2067550 RepID=UPI0011AED27B|nr:hypothetical protein [Clostridium sp. chh4-2]